MTSALDTRHGEGNLVPMHCNTNFGKSNLKINFTTKRIDTINPKRRILQHLPEV